jgi:hypothetical protein
MGNKAKKIIRMMEKEAPLLLGKDFMDWMNKPTYNTGPGPTSPPPPVLEAALKAGKAKIRLASNVKGDSDLTIPKGSIVTVTDFSNKRGVVRLEIEDIGGETASLGPFDSLADMPHQVVKRG